MKNTSNTSLETYNNPDNKASRLSHKNRIKTLFEKTNGRFTAREISQLTGLTYNQAYKRVSDLYNEGYLISSGEKKEFGNTNNIWQKSSLQLSMLHTKRKTRFELIKEAAEKIFDQSQYDALEREFKKLLNLQNIH